MGVASGLLGYQPRPQASGTLVLSAASQTSFPPSQSAVSGTTGLPIARACPDTSGTPVSAPTSTPATPCTTPSPVAVSSSAPPKLGTASCCHLVRRAGNLETNGPKRNGCVLPSLSLVCLPAGPSPAAPLGEKMPVSTADRRPRAWDLSNETNRNRDPDTCPPRRESSLPGRGQATGQNVSPCGSQ